MNEIEVAGADGAVLGTAQVDPTEEPLPRAVLQIATDASPAALAEAAIAAMPGHRLTVEEPGLAEALIGRAYPPEHPDHEVAETTPEGAAETIRGYLSGDIIGPLLADASAEARLGGVLAGMNVVSEMAADHRFAGAPWITDICVDPAAQGRGVGWALLGHAIDRLTAADAPLLGLAVTVGNPARQLYEGLGFVEQGTRWHLVNER